MNITQILESVDAMSDLKTQSLSLNDAIKVRWLQRELDSILEIYQDYKQLLLEKWGEGDPLVVPANKLVPYNLEHDKLLNEEIAIAAPVLNSNAIAGMNMIPDHVTKLNWLLSKAVGQGNAP